MSANTPATNTTNNTVCWADIPVLDLDRAIRFYSTVLGAKVAKESGPGFQFGLLPHSQNNASGCLCQTADNRPSEQGPLVYLSVEGRLDDAIKAARTSGGRIIQDKHPIGPHGHRAVIVDTEGNRVALHSHQA
ncbi:MAG: VOC family protein [Planctomycetes bacterium]|nr:VOC family protein [Planctomycetota bacterium]